MIQFSVSSQKEIDLLGFQFAFQLQVGPTREPAKYYSRKDPRTGQVVYARISGGNK